MDPAIAKARIAIVTIELSINDCRSKIEWNNYSIFGLGKHLLREFEKGTDLARE